jgi:type I restriction enzyme S subunit
MSTQLRSDFKQTEAGVIPIDWDTDTMLGVSRQIMDYRGRTPKKLGMDWGGGDIPALSAANVKMGFIDFEEECYFGSEALYSRWMTRGSVAKGDILFTTEAPLGSVALVPDDRKYILSQRTILLQVVKQRVSNRFLFQLMRSTGFQRMLADYSSGSTAKGIQRKKFEQLCVAVPTLDEQEAIAEALSDADALIESLEQLLTKKYHLKQGTMEELLTGKKRLPGFQIKPTYKLTEAGTIPEDWDVVSMGQISECLIGLTYSPLDVRDFGTLVLRSSNVQNGKLAFEDNVFVEMKIPARAITQKDDILICVRNGSRQLIGKCALIDDATAGSAFGAFMSVLRSDSAKFLFFQFQSGYQKRQIDEVMGATINQITNKDLAEFKVIWPSDVDERTGIAAVLSDVDAEITELETQLAKTRALKQGMMHKLLTGEIRLI